MQAQRQHMQHTDTVVWFEPHTTIGHSCTRTLYQLRMAFIVYVVYLSLSFGGPTQFLPSKFSSAVLYHSLS